MLNNILLEQAHKINAPFFLYDIDALDSHLKNLNNLPVKLWYAVKANPLSSIIDTIHKNDISFDVASVGELNQVLAQGVNPKNILNTGPSKSYEQLEYFIKSGVRTFVVESTQQYQDLAEICAKLHDVNVDVLLRVQLKWDESTDENNVLGGSSITPFGLPSESWHEYFLENEYSDKIDILGFHCFQWGNILSVEKLAQIWSIILAELTSLATNMNLDIKVIDLGGGIGVPYSKTDEHVNIDELTDAINHMKSEYKNLDIWLELGRFAVAECGSYVSKVVDIKEVYGENIIVLDSGVNHLLRPYIADEAFPARNISTDTGDDVIEYKVHGPLCTGIDSLGRLALDKNTKVGDFLAFAQVGAYGFSESMPFFLCHQLPAEIIRHESLIKVVRESKPASSWLV